MMKILCFGMLFHKVPQNHNPFQVPIIERIPMTIFPMTVHHLLPLITASPLTAAPPMHSIHVCGVWLWFRVTIHCGHDGFQVVHLDMVIPTISCFYSAIRTSTKVTRTVRGVGNGVVVDSMHVNDVDRTGGHGVKSSHGRTAYRANGCQSF